MLSYSPPAHAWMITIFGFLFISGKCLAESMSIMSVILTCLWSEPTTDPSSPWLVTTSTKQLRSLCTDSPVCLSTICVSVWIVLMISWRNGWQHIYLLRTMMGCDTVIISFVFTTQVIRLAWWLAGWILDRTIRVQTPGQPLEDTWKATSGRELLFVSALYGM